MRGVLAHARIFGHQVSLREIDLRVQVCLDHPFHTAERVCGEKYILSVSQFRI